MKVYQDKSLPKCVIVDIDGTIAERIGRSPYDYRKVYNDLPHKDIIELVELLMENYEIIFVSGREDSCYEHTKLWIEHYFSKKKWLKKLFRWQPNILMRKTGDHRPDYVVKKEIYDTYIKDSFYVQFCLDDRDQVVKLWRDMGFRCLQVAEGNF